MALWSSIQRVTIAILRQDGGDRTDTFGYFIADSDGSTSFATLTVAETVIITITSPTGGGGETFTISSPADLAANQPIVGSDDAANTDTLILDATGTHDLTTENVNNIDLLVLSANAAGSTVILGDILVSTADYNKDGLGGDLFISASAPLTSGIFYRCLKAEGLEPYHRRRYKL